MKIIKKIISTAMASILLLLSFSLPVQASGYYDYTDVSGQNRFKNEWELTRTYKVGTTVIAYMTYGLDTNFIDEDYVWTKSLECNSSAWVYRDGYDTGYHYIGGTEKGKGVYSKIEVAHITYHVYYKIKLTATYSNVTYSTARTYIKN